MTAALEACLWSADRAELALRELAQAAGLRPREPSRPFEIAADAGGALEERLESAAEETDVELEPASTSHADTDRFLAAAGPALLVLEDVDPSRGPRLAALLRARGRSAVLVAPAGERVRVPLALLRRRFRARLEGPFAAGIEPVLDAAGIRASARERARDALLAEQLGTRPVGRAWILRLPPGRPLLEQARQARLARPLAGVVAASAAASALVLASWIALGRGVLFGSVEATWIAAWILALASAMPLRWIEGWLQADFALRAGSLLRRRLLSGAARLDPADVRGEGSGALLGRVLESEAFESLALGGGLLIVGAVIDLVLAAWALSHAPHAGAGLALLGLGVAVALALGARQASRSRELADARRELSQDLVERMVGHRTRVAQEPPESWHAEEDVRLARYLESSRRADRGTLRLTACVAPATALLSFAALGWAYVAGASAPSALAIGIGSVLLGQQAIAKLSGALAQLAVCAATWSQVAPLWAAAARREGVGLPRAALRPQPPAQDTPLLAARGVSYRHGSRGRPALEDVDVSVGRGERVLVEGPSGGGKSTLASLVAGWRAPDVGTVLLAGLDRGALGASGWRARVAAAPQFHENLVFTASLAFNLLLGARQGEGDAEAEERALEVCRDLGLDELVARMPSGLRQLLGETGWQLSHGERGRLFVARALLSGGDLVLLDESLAGLDPVTARTVLDALERRAPTLVVVAHP